MVDLSGFLTRLKQRKNLNSVKRPGHQASEKYNVCFLRTTFIWACKPLWKIWQIFTWLSPQKCVSALEGTFLHTCTELQASFPPAPPFKIKAKFSISKVDLQICVRWANKKYYLKLAYTVILPSSLLPLLVSGANFLAGINPYRTNRNLIARNPSALLLVSNCHRIFFSF